MTHEPNIPVEKFRAKSKRAAKASWFGSKPRQSLGSLLADTCNLCRTLNCSNPCRIHIDEECTNVIAACQFTSDLMVL